MSQNLKNFFLLLLLACCWGPSFLFMKVAIKDVSPLVITCGRLLIGGVLLLLILKVKNISLPKPDKRWIHLFVSGLFQSAIPFTLFASGEKYVDSALAAIISGVSPLFTLFLAHFFTDHDKITKYKAIGSFIGFSGLLILVSPSLFDAKASFLGVIMVITAAMCYSISFVYTKKYVHGFRPIVAPTIQLFLGFLFLLPFCLAFGEPEKIFIATLPTILSIIGLGLLGTAAAFVLYYKVLEVTSPTYLSMVNYITPILGAILGVIVLGEKLVWNYYVGGIFILLGVMTANGLIKTNRCW